MLAVVRHDGGVGKRGRNAFESGEVEPVDNFSVGCIQENRFVGIVAGDENAFDAVDVCHAETGGISNVVELLAAKFSSGNCCARRERKKFFRRDVAAVEGVDSDAVTRVSRFLAERVGEARHRSVEAVAVEAESKSEEICLVRIVAQAIVREIRDVVGLQIENGERLLLAGRVGTVSAMKEDSEFLVGRQYSVGGKVVDWPGMAGGFR